MLVLISLGVPSANSWPSLQRTLLDGLDSLLSTVMMPKGVPVATVAINKAGAIHAAILAVQIMALSDPALKRKLTAYKKNMAVEVLKADAELEA